MTEAPTPAEDDPRFAAALELWLESQDAARVRSTFPEVAEAVLELAGVRGRLDRLFAAADPPAPSSVRIPGYEVARLLGRGGQGAVFLGRQTSVGRPVALKILWRQGGVDAASRQRFAREARAAGALRHAATVAVFDAGETGQLAWIAMEYVPGGTLAAALAARRGGAVTELLPTGAGARCTALAAAFAGAADGLAAAHAAGIVHRDVKPSNLLVGDDGVLKLADFGLAAMESGPRAGTMTGRPLGTLGYMAPEQARGERARIGPAADIYGLGVTLFEAAALHPAFSGDNDGEILARIMTGRAAAPRPPDGELPAAFAAILRRATETDPALRYPSAAAFAADLRAFAAGLPVDALRARPWARAWSTVRRRPAVATAVVVALLATATAVLGEANRREQDRKLASTAADARRLERARLWDDLRVGFVASLRAGAGDREALAALRATADRVAEAFRDDRALLARTGAMLALAGDEDGAARIFQLDLEAAKLPDALLVVATELQTPERAAKMVETAERDAPFDAFRNYLAGRALALADPVRAEAYLRAARTATGGDPAYVVEIGRVMADLAFRRGDPAEADEWLVAAHKESRLPSLLAARLPLLRRMGRGDDVRRVTAALTDDLARIENAHEWKRAIVAVAEFGDAAAAFELTGREPGRIDPETWADLRLRLAGGVLTGEGLIAEVQRILDRPPRSASVLRTGISLLGDFGRLDLAEKRFAEVLALDPESAHTRLDAAMWAALKGDEAAAWRHFAYVEKAGTDAAETEVSRARVLTTLGDYERVRDPARARDRFEEAAAILRRRLPSAPSATNWGETLLAIEVIRLGDGAAGAATAAHLMRTRASAEEEVAAVLVQASQGGAFEATLAALDGALGVQPDAAELLELRVRALAALERPDEALAASARLAEVHPRNFSAQAVRARVLLELGDDAAGALEIYRGLFAAALPAVKAGKLAGALDYFSRLASPADAPAVRRAWEEFRTRFPGGAPALVTTVERRLSLLESGGTPRSPATDELDVP